MSDNVAKGLDRTVSQSNANTADRQPDPRIASEVVRLVYELLDAHADTQYLAANLSETQEWAAHLEYLRALQRTGRMTLAHRFCEAGEAALGGEVSKEVTRGH